MIFNKGKGSMGISLIEILNLVTAAKNCKVLVFMKCDIDMEGKTLSLIFP